ncbi:hypothetical protein [Pararhodobacter aggregans]|nr:hypothetical protein [Pararhodobacter aggregans]
MAHTFCTTAFRGRNVPCPAFLLAEHTDVGDREGMSAVLLSGLGVY